jgi:putative addiction module component (TIGR02574 family)
MSDRVRQLLDQVLGLSDEEQLELVAALSSAFDERGLRPFDESWLAEIQRRSAEFDSGSVQAIPWAEVRQKGRQQASQSA